MGVIPFANTKSTAVVRASILTRYSSAMQRPASSEDQERTCRAAAEAMGWLINDDWVRHDRAKSGKSTHRRVELAAIIAAAKQKRRPFDVLILDDTSRLGRDLATVLDLHKKLKHYGVGLYFVSQKLDSRDPNFTIMLTIFGMADEQYSERLAKSVHRGQKGRVLKGFSSGSRCYGYRSVPLRNPELPEDAGRSSMLGVVWEVINAEADVIRRIFTSFADGMSTSQICTMLHDEGVPGARHPKIGPVLAPWNATLVKRILHNEKYIGKIIWNENYQKEDPETGGITTHKKSLEEVIEVDAPHLRIVSDELWRRVRDRFVVVNDELKNYRLGGLNRTKRIYLFSGLLQCGVCGNDVLISGGKNSEAAYQCTSARHNRGCENRLRIRQDRFTTQMIEALKARLLDPASMNYLVSRVEKEFNQHLKQVALGLEDKPPDHLQRLHSEQQVKVSRLTAAIEATPTELASGLIERLAEAQKILRAIAHELAESQRPEQPQLTKVEIAEMVRAAVERLQDICMDDKLKARRVIQQYVKRLILTPVRTEAGLAFDVQGTINLFAGAEDSEEGVLLDCPRTRTVQQYTNCEYHFAGLRLLVKADHYQHEVTEFEGDVEEAAA